MEYSFRVALHDTDAAGVMFFAHLFRHAHDAYEALMEQLELPLASWPRAAGIALPLVHAAADYHAPLHHGALVVVTLAVTRVGGASFALRYRFTQAARPAASATTVHACIALSSGRSCPLPAPLAAALRTVAETDG